VCLILVCVFSVAVKLSDRHNSIYGCVMDNIAFVMSLTVAYPRIFFGGGSTNSVEDRGQREWGSGGGSPLVKGSGGSCNSVQEISFHIVKFS